VFVPIRRTIDFDAARHVSELVGRHLMRLHPKDITQEWSVPKRTGKIFMDYNMNVRGKTLNVAYSPRGEPGAPVSMPLTWEELAGAHPLDFTITNASARLAQTGDRWQDALTRKQSLEKALSRTPAHRCGKVTHGVPRHLAHLQRRPCLSPIRPTPSRHVCYGKARTNCGRVRFVLVIADHGGLAPQRKI
jgi:hypothetical protein